MRSERIRLTGGLALTVAIATVAAIASAGSVKLKNPGFETGDFRAWKTFERGGGEWQVYRQGDGPAPPAPRQGFGFPSFPDPPRGERAAIVYQEGPGLNILHRVLKPKRDAVNKLRFFLYYRNAHNRFYSPNHFRFGGGPTLERGGGGQPNQQLRIDLIKRGAPLKSLRQRHILATLLRTRRGDDLRRRYKPLRANLTRLGINRPFRLRIAEVDNRGVFLVGVDALKLKFKR